MIELLNDPGWWWWLKLTGYAAFSAAGGFLGELLRTMDQGRIQWSRSVVQGMGAGFTGIVVVLLCQAMGLSDQWTGAVVGVLGWLGARASMVVVEKVVYKRLGIIRKEPKPEE
ncbi:hypothetical protein [Pseudomonas virus PBPA162]|uniref:Holin n=3 Tax=Viruses TaxID=10239 RepID=A0A7S5EDM2_9CAUD|nr:holin [Pseudomonas phage Iggy]YP_010671807.1 hypothetical protein PQC32_gp44 [Pseudomonas virus PBPA162]QDB70878.1 hypothetical protein [Pseudomonas virus PBPA162]QEA09731.1 holin [Pseudomonas phage Iggy]